MRYGSLIAHICFWAILFLLILSGKSVCRAETQFVKTWNLDQPRQALVVGLTEKCFLFSLGIEYRESYEVEDTTYETFGAAMSFSAFKEWKTGSGYWSPTVRLGGGMGFLLELEWSSREYDLAIAQITYPGIDAEVWFYGHGWGSFNMGAVLLTFDVRFNDDWVQSTFGTGFIW